MCNAFITFLKWVVYKLLPVSRRRLQECLFSGFDLFVEQLSVFVPEGFSVASRHNSVGHVFYMRLNAFGVLVRVRHATTRV